MPGESGVSLSEEPESAGAASRWQGTLGKGKPGLCELPAVAEERTQCCKLSVEKGSAPSNPISTT